MGRLSRVVGPNNARHCKKGPPNIGINLRGTSDLRFPRQRQIVQGLRGEARMKHDWAVISVLIVWLMMAAGAIYWSV